MAAPIFRIDAPRPIQDTTQGIRESLKYFSNINQQNIANAAVEEQRLENQRRFDLQQARQEANDKESARRWNAQENWRKEERDAKEAKELDIAKANAMLVKPISFDTTKKERGVFTTDKKVDEYDAGALQKSYDSNPEQFNVKEVQKIKKNALDQESLKIEQAFSDIDLNPIYKTEKERNEAKDDYLKKNKLLLNEREEEDGPWDIVAKGAGSAAGKIGSYAISSGKSLLNPFKDVKEINEELESDLNVVENYYKIDKSPLELANERIKTLQEKRQNNESIEARNTKLQKEEEDRVAKLIDSFKTGKKVDQTKVDTKTVAVAESEILKEIYAKAKIQADEINNDPKLTEMQKLRRVAKVKDEQKNALKNLDAQKAKLDELRLWKSKEDYKVKGQAYIEEVKAKIKQAQKSGNEKLLEELQVELKKAEIANKNADTKKKLNDL